jgi:hypothetical protein
MGALSAQRVPFKAQVVDQLKMSLKDSTACWKGGMAAIELATGKVAPPPTATAGWLWIGFFAESVASGTSQLVNIEMARPFKAYWLENTDAGHTVAAGNVGSVCYINDDQSVTMDTTTASKAGRVWAVGTIDGVASALVEPFAPAVGDS